MPVAPVVYRPGEDVPIENAPVLTEEDKHTIKQKMEALDKLFAEQGKARYKIEIFFKAGRSSWKPSVGILSFWESGAKLHGGGDAKMYICPGKKKGVSQCEAFIPDSGNGYGHLVCPACGKVWEGEDVIGEVVANLTMQNWAKAIYGYYKQLGLNADICVKHAKSDIHNATILEQERQRGGELLGRARTQRVQYVYPLKNIIKDTSNGADLLARFYAFLTA